MTPTPEPSPSVSVSRELIGDTITALEDCAESLLFHETGEKVCVERADNAVSFLRLALTQPQPEAPAPANPLAGWTDLHVAGDWLAGRPPGAQAVRAIAQVSAPAPALPAEAREVLLLVAQYAELVPGGTAVPGVDWKRVAALHRELTSLDPTRLRALAGAEAGEQGAR